VESLAQDRLGDEFSLVVAAAGSVDHQDRRADAAVAVLDVAGR
jgi:hypothetical protein